MQLHLNPLANPRISSRPHVVTLCKGLSSPLSHGGQGEAPLPPVAVWAHVAWADMGAGEVDMDAKLSTVPLAALWETTGLTTLPRRHQAAHSTYDTAASVAGTCSHHVITWARCREWQFTCPFVSGLLPRLISVTSRACHCHFTCLATVKSTVNSNVNLTK